MEYNVIFNVMNYVIELYVDDRVFFTRKGGKKSFIEPKILDPVDNSIKKLSYCGNTIRLPERYYNIIMGHNSGN